MKMRMMLCGVFLAFSAANGATVGGKVTDGNSGNPVPGAYVEIFTFSESESVFVATGFADTGGVYAFEGVPEGVYFANSIAAGYATTRFYNVRIPANGLLLDIVLYPPYGDPGGIVIGTDSSTVASAEMVWTLASNSQEYNITSDLYGRFSLAGLPAGAYQVSVTASGYVPCQFSTQVGTGLGGYGIVLVPESPTSSDETPGFTPAGYVLNEAFPNPFNPSTTLRYELPAESHVRVEVIDVSGVRVALLVDGNEQAGIHTAVWDAHDQASGTYFCVLSAGRTGTGRPERVAVRKVALVR